MDHHIFTGTGIDSVTSYLTFNWLTEKRIPVEYVSRDNIKDKVTSFFKNTPQSGKTVYFINLDTTDLQSIVDRDNVVIIDHHPDHLAKKSIYKKCKTILKLHTSCCKLIYTLLSKKFPGKLTDRQKLLVLLTDDLESYTYKIPNSYELGVIYNNLQGNKPVRYYSLYKDGFLGFSQQQQDVIDYYKQKFEKIKSELQAFTAGPLHIKSLSKNKYKYVSTFATGFVNEISDHLLDKYNSDICLITNLDTQRVFIRRSKTCDANLKNLATLLCNGWGYDYAAGGKVTEKFLTFSKLFSSAK